MRKRYLTVLTMALCLVFLTRMPATAQSEERYSAMASNNTFVVSSSTGQPDAHMVYPAVYKIEGPTTSSSGTWAKRWIST